MCRGTQGRHSRPRWCPCVGRFLPGLVDRRRVQDLDRFLRVGDRPCELADLRVGAAAVFVGAGEVRLLVESLGRWKRGRDGNGGSRRGEDRLEARRGECKDARVNLRLRAGRRFRRPFGFCESPAGEAVENAR